jgi:glucose-6-phosphate 1-dehydrogenase
MPEAVATVSVDGQSENPLRAGLHTERISDPCSIVFFGASGDLFKRMLLPAVYSLRLHGTLPNDFAVVGVSRAEYTDDSFRDYCKEQLEQFAPADQKPQGAIWVDLA